MYHLTIQWPHRHSKKIHYTVTENYTIIIIFISTISCFSNIRILYFSLIIYCFTHLYYITSFHLLFKSQNTHTHTQLNSLHQHIFTNP